MSEVAAVDTVASGDDQFSFEAALAAALGTNDSAEQAQAPAAVVAAPVTTPPPPVSATPEAPSAAQLERAAALEAREAKLRDAEERSKKIDAREADLTAREARTAKQWDAFASDPVGHIMAMRPELSPPEAAKIAEKLYFHAMGDKAPLEHRQQQEVTKVKTEVRSEVDQLRAEIEELRATRVREEQQSEIATYRTELRTGAAAVTDAPIVASLIKRNPERASELLFEVARRAAVESKQQGAAEPVVLTPAQAAAQLEAILKAQRDDLYGPDASPPVTQPNVQQSVPSPTTTITNRDASIQPSRTAPDPLDDKTLRKAALEAAGLGHLAVWD